MDDELYQPLGFPPRPKTRSAEARPRGARFSVAIAILALAVSSLSLVRREAQAPFATAKAPKQSVVPSDTVARPPIDSEQTLGSSDVVQPPPPPPSPIATAAQAEAASGVKIAPKTVPGAPVPLIIDVQHALAEAKLRAALDARLGAAR